MAALAALALATASLSLVVRPFSAIHDPLSTMHVIDFTHKRSGQACMSGGKPKRSVRAVMPASSHSKSRPHWRDTALMSASAVSDHPALQGANANLSPGKFPVLVLNADYTPLSYVPLSVWSWQDSVKAVFRGAVIVLSTYDNIVSSPSVQMKLPSVIVLKHYVSRGKRRDWKAAFTRRNVYLRDRFCCVYCGTRAPLDQLTYDHVTPRSKGGPTTWENVVTACKACNLRKGDRLLKDIPDMKLPTQPISPTW
jgi:5-methylcytosine-specific restriction endonuclease McrA